VSLNLQHIEFALFFSPKSAIPARRTAGGQNPKSCLNWLFVQALFNCRVDSGGTEQHAIETNLAKAGLVNDLSKFLGSIKVAHGM